MKITKVAATVLLASLGVCGCYPGGPNSIDDVGLVVTSRNTTFNFQQLNTFSLPDDVVVVTGNYVAGEPPAFVSDPYAQDILTAIRQNMTAYGWVEVDESANPDVVILPSAMSATTASLLFNNYLYWDWYFAHSGNGWEYSYPVYGGDYSAGSVVIQMAYPDGITAEDNIPVVWVSFCNGLLEGSTSSISGRITTGLNKAFQQSPYLHQ